MKINILHFVLLLFITQCGIGQTNTNQEISNKTFDNEWQGHYAKSSLNGKVKSISEVGYDLFEKKGKFKKGKRKQYVDGMSYIRKRLRSSLTVFDKFGNLLETNSLSKEGDFTKQESFQWDSYGNLTKLIFHSASEVKDSIVYHYNYEDNEVKETYYYKARPKTYNVDSVLALHLPQLEKVGDPKVRHQMDSMLRSSILANANYYNNNPPPLISHFISTYDEHGQLIETCKLDSKQLKTTVIKFIRKYENGLLIEVMNLSDPNSSFGEVYKYDDRGNQTKNTFIGPDGLKSRIFSTKYDEHNNVIRTRILSSNPRLIRSETIQEYDANNNLIRRISDDLKGRQYIQTFKYDLNNNVITEKHASEKFLKHEYKYDRQNNWISKKTFRVNIEKDGREVLVPVPVSMIERKITYH